MRTLILFAVLLFSGISSAVPTVVTFDQGQWLSPVYEEIIAKAYGENAVSHIKALLNIECSVSITINIGE